MSNQDKRPTLELTDAEKAVLGKVESRIEVQIEGHLVEKIDDIHSLVKREFKERRASSRELLEHFDNFVKEIRTAVGVLRTDVEALRHEVDERVTELESRVAALEGKTVA